MNNNFNNFNNGFNQNQNQNQNRFDSNSFFQNSGYINNRNKRQTFILDVVDNVDNGSFTHLSDGSEFTIKLYEPLIIDSHSEVYLDNFVTMNSNISSGSDGNDSGFVLRIKEFNTITSVASNLNTSTVTYNLPDGSQSSRFVPGGQHIARGLIIPNDNASPENNHMPVVHKSKKFNYVCDINPTRIDSLTVQVTNLNGDPIFHGRETTATNTYTLVNLDKDISVSGATWKDPLSTNIVSASDVFPLREGDIVSELSASGISNLGNNASGSILALHPIGVEDLHFSYGYISDSHLPCFNGGGRGDISFTVTRKYNNGSEPSYQQVTISTTDVSDIGLIRTPGRFTAEFSIVSKD